MQCALRPWRVEDAADLARSLNNEKIMNNLRDGLPYPYTKSDALEYIKAMHSADPHSTFAFAFTVEDRVVGSIGAFRQGNIHYRTAEPSCVQKMNLDKIPAVLYGEPSDKAYLFVHGMNGCKEEAAAFAEIACPKGYQVLSIDLPEHGERKGKKERINPQTAVPELSAVFSYMKSRWSEISLRANSIGAHFSMLALEGEDVCKALFVSPIVDMERLIADMMGWAGVDERELREQGEIVTAFGQTLSWDYLTWEREHPVSCWRCPTAILYAGGDNMTDRQTMEQFSAAPNVKLSIMESGEHWFHTPEQLRVLKAWEQENV